jgi:hypothetical protein
MQNFNTILAFYGREEHQKLTLYRFPSASNNCPSQFELTLRSPWHQLRILFAVLGRLLFNIASARHEKAKRADHETMHAYAAVSLLTMCPTPSQKLVCVCIIQCTGRTQWLNSLQKANTLSPRSLLLSTARYIFNHTRIDA